jgi:hypothetical protein
MWIRGLFINNSDTQHCTKRTGCFLPPPTSFKSFQRPKNSTKNRPAYAEQMAGEFLLVSLQDGVYSIEKFKKGRTEYRWHFQNIIHYPDHPVLSNSGTAYPKKERTVP